MWVRRTPHGRKVIEEARREETLDLMLHHPLEYLWRLPVRQDEERNTK